MQKNMQRVIWIALVAVSQVFAQIGMQRPTRGLFSRELFAWRVLNFADVEDRSQSLMHVHLQWVNDVLVFIKEADDRFTARYDIELILYNQKNEVADYAMLRDTVTVSQFSETNLRLRPIHKKMLLKAPPGRYQFSLKLINSDGKVLVEERDSIRLTDFSVGLQISDLILADQVDCLEGSYVINVRNAFSQQKSDMGLLFELYPPMDADSVRVQLDLRDLNGHSVHTESQIRAAKPILGACFSLKEIIKKPGEYQIRIQASSGSLSARAEHKFMVFWGDAQSQLGSLDLAIEQLALIAKGSTIREMRAASPQEREKLYEAFWEKRDPDPATPENELRDEFFFRIDLANRQFAEPMVNREGWRSDRGRILIQYGQPDDIERQAAEMYSPAVEIWSYTKPHRRFIFVDRSGNGEFRLVKNQ